MNTALPFSEWIFVHTKKFAICVNSYGPLIHNITPLKLIVGCVTGVSSVWLRDRVPYWYEQHYIQFVRPFDTFVRHSEIIIIKVETVCSATVCKGTL